jgi:hypothetical protein
LDGSQRRLRASSFLAAARHGHHLAPPARRLGSCQSRLQPWCCPVFCKLAAEARDVAQVPMAALVAAAALAAAEPAPAVPQAAGSGGPTSRRDFYWLRSFLAGGQYPPPGPRGWVLKPVRGPIRQSRASPAAAPSRAFTSAPAAGANPSAEPSTYFLRLKTGSFRWDMVGTTPFCYKQHV